MTEEIQAQEPITAFKGFDRNLQCRGYQYEIGKTYKHEGEVEACASGFHSCEFPLDVFNYYAPAEGRFAIVTASGKLSRHGSDSKVASAELTIQAEIGIPKLVEKAVEFIISKCDFSGAATNTGDQSAATNTGYKSAATNTGYKSAATNTGDQSAATNTGDQSAATNTGYKSAATNTGYKSAATNTGYKSAATNTGNYSAATNTGDQSAATNTGYKSAASVEGKHSVAISTGYKSKAKAGEAGAIVLVYRNDDYALIHIRASKVGDNGIKPDVWYSLNADGEFVECDE